jgi:hypothetical protein
MIDRERERQRIELHAVHGDYQHHVELSRNQPGLTDCEISMLKRAEIKERNGTRQFKGRRQRCGDNKVIATLLARRRAPADA